MSPLIRDAGEGRRRRFAAMAVAALALAGAAAPALADDHRGHDRHVVVRHDRDWYRRHHRPVPAYIAPGPVYAPPPVVYAPPPQPPGLNLIFPLNFR